MAKKGKTPTLLCGRAGAPKFKTAGRKRPCNRCEGDIYKGGCCIEVPVPGEMGRKNTYCCSCFDEVLTKTQEDLTILVSENQRYSAEITV